ncbi:MAG TPA: hypothetical protein VMG12_32295 [Polyangiaceae bacterium]|nr:hypothetical protein [Polyangiaceae bacterium]
MNLGSSRARRRHILGAAGWLAALVLSGVVGCAQHSDEGSPEWVAREFIDRMQRVHGDVQKSKAAYDLLAADARAKLEERAERASAAVGRVVRPEEMLAPSRFYLSFQPRAWSSREGPGWAVVTIEGESARERREVRCLREQGEWKVVLDLPELPPLEHRQVSAER